LLRAFIDEPSKAKELLDEFYHLYITFDRHGEQTNGYRFLGNLALNNFYWMDTGYLQFYYRENWKKEYEKNLSEVPFYHDQLVPIAEQIFVALESGQIRISRRGEYQIDEHIKKVLETDQIFTLKHPGNADN